MGNQQRILVVGLVVGVAAMSAGATNGYLNAFKAKYPGSTLPARMQATTGSQCWTCHHPTSYSNPGTCYKETLVDLLGTGMTIQQALNVADSMDSDGDGVPNGVEITTPRTDRPDVGYHPGLIGDRGTDPCGPSPTAAVTNILETPPPPCVADLTSDGLVDFSDYLEFLNRYESQDPSVDFNMDGLVDFADYLEFLSLYDTGC